MELPNSTLRTMKGVKDGIATEEQRISRSDQCGDKSRKLTQMAHRFVDAACQKIKQIPRP